jgi:hypothetical protein
MTQWEYDTILMALDGGVPALADKLSLALQNLVNERNKLSEDNKKLKEEKGSIEGIVDYLIDNTNVSEMSGIRFSELTYQPWTRDQHRTAAHPERRYVMQVKWGSMTNCINNITRRRNNNDN